MKYSFIFVGSFLFLPSITNAQTLLDSLLTADTSAVIQKVLANPDTYRLQIFYSKLSKNKEGKLVLTHYSYRPNNLEYFYPASLVKLPMAALALEYLNEIKIEGVNAFTPLKTNPVYAGWKKDSLPYPSVAQNCRDMFVVSDNAAFNRLYDLLGQEYIHLRLFEKGYAKVRIVQRLAGSTQEENRVSGPFQFIDSTGKVLFEEGALTTLKKFDMPANGTQVGYAYRQGGKLIKNPKDFSGNNFLPLADAHQMLISLLLPKLAPQNAGFNLVDQDYQILSTYMSIYPREANVDKWLKDTAMTDTYRKFLFFGNKPATIDSTIRVFNKVGVAYGFMSDVAYFCDLEKNISFFLSAVIYANEDGVLNDNRYDYNIVAYPFMERLGKLVYRYESSRNDPVLVLPKGFNVAHK